MKSFWRVLLATSLLALFTATALRAQDQGPSPEPESGSKSGPKSGSSRTRGSPAIHSGISFGSTCRHRRLGRGGIEPSVNQGGQYLGGQELAHGTERRQRNLRVNAESSLTLTNISDNRVQVQLHQGT